MHVMYACLLVYFYFQLVFVEFLLMNNNLFFYLICIVDGWLRFFILMIFALSTLIIPTNISWHCSSNAAWSSSYILHHPIGPTSYVKESLGFSKCFDNLGYLIWLGKFNFRRNIWKNNCTIRLKERHSAVIFYWQIFVDDNL